MLVAAKQKDGAMQFQVHKQGLLLLRKFRNKRLRIVFNVTHLRDDLEQFNACFLAHPPPTVTTPPTNNISQLRISEYFQQLSDNRVIIFLNAFQDPNNTNLLVIGYLVASVFFYHNHQQLSEHSHLTNMLAKLKKQLEATQVDKLQQEIKYKSGCCKKPYLMCLFDEHINKQSCHELFRQFYKYREDKNSLNQSVDTLIDYFPERSAMSIASDKEREGKVKKLGEQYLKTILGRQIFNFEITGWTLQNLCFELCEIFNNKTGSINLVSIYNKIINNQKTQVFDYSTQEFTKLTTNLTLNLPYQPVELQQAYGRIQKYIIQESIADACNCMIFTQYQTIYKNLLNIMEKKYKSIQDKNKQLLRDRTISCYEKIQEDQVLQQQIQNINSENAVDLLELISEKIGMFIQENVHEFNTKDMLIRLINKYIELYGQNLRNHLDERDQNEKKLVNRASQVETDNKIYQIKCKELENEFKYLNSLNNQFKQKLLNLNPNQYGAKGQVQNQGCDILIFNDLNTKILNLEAQLNEKNQVIESLTETLDKFDTEFNRKFHKPKFSKDIQNILSEINHKMNDIYSLFNDLKKTQKFYQDIENQFQLKKKELDKIRQKQKFQLQETKEKMNQIGKEKTYTQKTLQEARNAIHNLENVKIQYQDRMNQLQNSCSRLKCFLAETQGDFQKYKKALELTINCYLTGKVDKLKDFYKVSTDQDLKQLLKPIFKK